MLLELIISEYVVYYDFLQFFFIVIFYRVRGVQVELVFFVFADFQDRLVDVIFFIRCYVFQYIFYFVVNKV